MYNCMNIIYIIVHSVMLYTSCSQNLTYNKCYLPYIKYMIFSIDI